MISLNGAVSRAAFSRGLLERPCRWATPRRGVRAAAACRSWWAPDSRQHPLVPVSQVGLTRTSDLAECIASCRREVAAIVAHHRVTGDRYVDCDFPVGDPEHGWRCIFEHPHELLHPADLLAPPEWKRLSDVYPPAELSLFRGEYADSGDIVQGNIGTCFFLGSLAAMAHGQKGWVRQLFVAHDAAAGVYGVRFFKRGRWECVLVDDLVGYPSPSGSRTSCLSTGHRDQFAVQRRPWFSHNSVEGTIWVAIIEKAYAKLHGSYEAINTGHTREAMVDLSGGVMMERFYLDNEDGRPFAGREAEDAFRTLERSLAGGCVLSCEIVGEREAAVREAPGLISGHLYSILDVAQIESAEGGIERKVHQLVQIRNPWGHTGWQGAWSDRAKEWAENPGAQQHLGYTFHDDGVFWMAIEDFCRIWSLVDGCKMMPASWRMAVALDRWVQKVDNKHGHHVEEDGLLSSTQVWTITVAASTDTKPDCASPSAIANGGRKRATGDDLVQCALVLQQERSNLGVISLRVFKTNGPDATECSAHGVISEPSALVRSAAWTWRRGALIDSLLLERGQTYLVVPFGAEDQDPGSSGLAGTELLLRLYADKHAGVHLWRNGQLAASISD